MLHDLIDEKYLEGPRDWSSPFADNFDWVVLAYGCHSDEQIDEMVQWCLKNCISKFSWGFKYRDSHLGDADYGFIFQNMYDAFAFKLRWL